MDDSRKDRRATLDAVVEIIQKERGVVWPATSELTAECEDVLERCLFERDAALEILRGEHELDDDPWDRCPDCDCDTYFRMKVALERSGDVDAQPVTMFVCEGCHHIAMRGRSTVELGAWWTSGTRFRARVDGGHPYRGEVDEPEHDDDDDDDEADHDEDVAATDASAPVEWSERQVCSDGACIGLINASGRCSVCGRAGEDGPR